MEELINNIDSIQIELETAINKMQQNLKELKTKAATIQAQQKQGQDQADTRFTLCTLKELSQTEDNGNEPPTINIIKEEEDEISEDLLIVTAGTDGSLMSKRGRRVSAAAVYFGDGSPLNSAKAVLGASSSTIPEVDAFIELLYTAKREKVTKVAAVIDNVTAISFIECSAKKDIICSRMMQHFLLNNPALESRAEAIRDLMPFFSLVIARWQKAHTNQRTIFADLNRAADSSAKQRASEILNLMLK